MNRRALEALIRSGALDVFETSRAVLFASIDIAFKSAEQHTRNDELGQNDLFSVFADTPKTQENSYVQAEAWSDTQRLRGEKETLGLYMTGHPLDAYEAELSALVTASMKHLTIATKPVVIAGVVVSIRTLVTRGGKRMAIVTLEDRTHRIDVTLFNDLYQHIFQALSDDVIFVVKGTVSKDDYTGGIKLVADTMMSLDNVRAHMAKRLLIRIETSEQADHILAELPNIIQSNAGGRCPIAIAYQNQTAGAELILGENWRVKPSAELLARLNRLCGQNKVVVEY